MLTKSRGEFCDWHSIIFRLRALRYWEKTADYYTNLNPTWKEMFLQQTDEMLLCYNVFPLHDPMERFYGHKQKITRKNNIKITGKQKVLYLDFHNFTRGFGWAYKQRTYFWEEGGRGGGGGGGGGYGGGGGGGGGGANS